MLTTLLLFDIDGTLIRGTRAGRMALALAVRSCLGVADDLQGIQLGGRTDPLILRDVLTRHGIEPTPAHMDQLLSVYLDHLRETVRASPGVVCPGVESLLPALSQHPRTWLALGTGNVEQGAWMKLRAHGLDRFFQTGGFGSDAADRNALIAAGIARAEARYGTSFRRVVVIGDTPLDVACAQANGVHSLGVATGTFPLSALEEVRPTLVFPDLTHTDAVMQALDTLPPTGSPPTRAGPPRGES